MWTEVGKGQLIGPELVQETSEKILQIKDRLKHARGRQKSYVDKRRKPLEFSVGEYVLLKVSPWKCVVRFGKKRKLAPRESSKKLKRSEKIAIVKDRWNFETVDLNPLWEREDLSEVNDQLVIRAKDSVLGKSIIQMCELNTGYDWERMRIMPPKMMTRSVGRATAAPRGGRTSGRTGRGGGRPRGRSCDQVNGGIDGQGNQGSNLGNGRNQNGNTVNDNVQGDVRNVIVNNDQWGCTYKEFLACNPKEYDGKASVIVYTRWIEKMESV
ncbi:hypothetical protein Tco_0884066 [Tanacetum coccineum]